MKLSSEQLKKVKVGDILFVKGEKVTVKRTGYKYITLDDARETTISIERACSHFPNYPQLENDIYSSQEGYQAYVNYCKEMDDARKTLRTFMNRISNSNLLKVAAFIENPDKEKEA